MGQPTITYCNYSTTATATASLTGNGNGSDVLIETEDTYYAPLATTSFNIVIDLGATLSFDTLTILGNALNGTTLEVRGSTDNFVASDVSIDTATALVGNANTAWVDLTLSSYRYVKFLFSGHASTLRISNICLVERLLLPYFETDPDIDNVTPTGVQLISQAGTYNGSNQQKAMRDMSLNWGEVTASELVNIKLFADNCITVIKPFYFIPDVAETDAFFGWIPGGGSFQSPQTPGVYTINPIQFETRAV
jgi:hypothetical protein